MTTGNAIFINTGRCVGCGRCASVCIRDSIHVEGGKAVYTGEDCFACYHCYAACPKGAIRIVDDPEFKGVPPSGDPVGYDAFMDLLRARRSTRWFNKDKVTREEFDRLLAVGGYSPSGMNLQDVEFVVVDEKMDEFMHMVYDVLKPVEDELPRIREFCEYMEGTRTNPKGHPFMWEGRQLVLAFSEVPTDAIIAMTRVELAGCTMGIGGFYSLFLIIAANRDPEAFSEFFPEVPKEKELQCVYVVGHPRLKYRRDIPPRDCTVTYM